MGTTPIDQKPVLLALSVTCVMGCSAPVNKQERPWLNQSMEYETLEDKEGNVYATIMIGELEWMAENLRTTRYQNGDTIPNVTDSTSWAQLNTGAWVHYANDPSYAVPFGNLYNGYAITDPRNVCPVGWHVPAERDWQQLELELGLSEMEISSAGERGSSSDLGGKLKSLVLWDSLNASSTNEYGFAALPGGKRGDSYFDDFSRAGQKGEWWSSTETVKDSAWVRSVTIPIYYGVDDEIGDLFMVVSDRSGFFREVGHKGQGRSVRCVREAH